jgi:tetratricopeptide (TPR) repeat protein
MRQVSLGVLGGAFLVLLANTAYIASSAAPTIFYMGNVLVHLLLGLVLLIAALFLLPTWRDVWGRVPAGLWVLLGSGALGAAMAYTGTTRDFTWLLWAHIVSSITGLVMLAFAVRRKEAAVGGGWTTFRRCYEAGLLLILVAPVLSWSAGKFWPEHNGHIANSLRVPLSMDDEGEGPQGHFWPSSAKTNVGFVPQEFFFDSKKCGECHKDIYEQWESSMHHFASFNNQFYRKSIEHMQEIGGTKPSRWCAGCHDHAVLFTGRWETPIKDQIDTPHAHAGLTCVSCHAITHVEGSMGNGGFTLGYPEIHKLAASDNKWIHLLDRFLTNLEPEPHRKSFLKPFMKDNSEFCSSCHKVHLDVPVNNYRWIRGFNDYDNWQASGVSGQGARSFYYPAEPLTCSGCHMPLVPSKDPGNRNGMVHSHRFPAANTAVPYVNGDKTQLAATQGFLQSGFISVDIFAAAPVDESNRELQMLRRAGQEPELMSTFAVGEEAMQGGSTFLREVGQVAAPIDKSGAVFRPGSTVRVDVVVRTRKIGHFFPGGTVDGFDVWLELQGRDADGKIIYWSGAVEDGGRGPVEAGAHFYRSYMLDGEGNPINKRNAWQARSVLYVKLIPPGAADTAHYRVKIPPDARGPITLTAKLNHRKFSHYFTQFSYAGKAKPGQEHLANVNHDSREYSFDPANIPHNVSGKIKGEIPVLPITVLARAEAKLEIGDRSTVTEWKPVVKAADWERWNDWGIGLLLQGDLKGAEYAFKKATEADSRNADGWLNVARTLVQEGETDAAKPYLERALELNPKLARIHFFKGLVEKADGDYDAALVSMRTVEAMYPRDRVVCNQIGRLLFLKRDYKEAIAALKRVLAVDPEDLQAHYNLMLSYRGLGETESATRHEQLFRRFKADEASQTITAKRRMVSPEDNNERQAIHDHDSVPLPWGTKPATARDKITRQPRQKIVAALPAGDGE